MNTQRNFLFIVSMLAANTVFAEKMPVSASYWSDSAFLKDFNGSYRINANIEPVLSGVERAELIAIQDVMAKGDRSAAIAKLKSSKSSSTSAAIQFNLGNLLSEEGELDDAITCYLKALKILPSFRRAHQNLAYVYFKKNSYDEAFPHLIQAVQLGGQDGSVYGLLGHCYQQKDQYEQALVAFRNAQLTQPEVMDWKIGVGYSLDRLGRTDEALAHFERLAEEAPESTAIALQLANLYLTKNQQSKAIVKLELLSRKGEIDTAHEILLGTLYLSDQNSQLGASTLRRVLSREGFEDHTAALQAVRYCVDLSLAELADELYRLVDVSQLDVSQKVVHRRLAAEVLLQENLKSEKALAILRELVAANPTDTHSLYLVGNILLRKQLHQEALVIFDQAIHSDGSHSQPALLKKAELLASLERYQQAIACLDAYLKTNQSEAVASYREAIKNVVKARTTVRQ